MATIRKQLIRLGPGGQYALRVKVPDHPEASLAFDLNGDQVFIAGPGETIEIIVQADMPSPPAVALPAPMPPPLPPATATIEQPRRQMPPVIEEPAAADLN
jgi:hypothetical protein